MARSKIPVVDNSLTPDEQEFIAGGTSDNNGLKWCTREKGENHRTQHGSPGAPQKRNESLQGIRRI